MNGVCAYSEQTGAVILAEGVKTDHRLMAAQTMGATLAQGWYFGRPGPLHRPATARRLAGTGLGVVRSAPLN